MSETITELKEAEKAAAEEKGKGITCYRQDWIPGAFLIGLGAIFLLNNLAGFHLYNWWALFIFIPAFSNFSRAWNKYQQHGRVTRGVRKTLTGGLILSLVASTFLFNWYWGYIWPSFLIIIGLGILLE
ncbi:MAG: hypothetical protein ACE5EY_02460, partial [Anaerolineae bacterium]